MQHMTEQQEAMFYSTEADQSTEWTGSYQYPTIPLNKV